MSERNKQKVGAVMVVQNDEETVERALASFYDHVDIIFVSTDPVRGWSGQPITPDRTLDLIHAMDRDHKIRIVEADYCKYDHPMRNETYQRQVTADALAEQLPGLDWIVQIDADEEFLDFGKVLAKLATLPARTKAVTWRLAQLFHTLDDGRYLVIVGESGQPILETYGFAHRPNARLRSARHVEFPPMHPLLRRLLTIEYRPRSRTAAPMSAIHYGYAKSEARIYEKLQTWGHTKDFDTAAFFELWKRSKTEWPTMRNFHPVYPIAWPALKPFTLDALRAYLADWR